MKIQAMISKMKDAKQFFRPSLSSSVSKLKIIDIRMALFMTEHNYSALSLEHLVRLFKSNFKMLNPLNELTEKIRCSRTKITAIIQNVLGKSGEEAVLKKIREQNFSLLIDESTDCTTD